MSASEFALLRVREGDLAEDGSWVYAWLDRDAGAVVYVGATALDPATRVWLHLHHEDPEIGRMRARFGALASARLDVLALRVPEGVSRADLRDVLGTRLAEEGLLAADAILDHLQPLVEPAAECLELADRFVARLRASIEHGR